MFLDKRIYGGAFVDESANLDDAMIECAVGVERAWGEMMLECCAMEFKAYQESGDIDAVNEGGIIESIKKWFKKLWNVIKSFFSKAVNVIRSKTMTCKEYYDKYKKDIDAGVPKIKDFKGFKYVLNYKNDASTALATKVSMPDELNKYAAIEKDEDAKKAIIKAIATAANFEAADKTEDLMKNAQKKWQGGTTDKVTLDAEYMNSAISNIKSDLTVKNIALRMKISENILKEMEVKAEKTYKEDENDDVEKSKDKNRKISFIRTIVSTVLNLQTKYSKMLSAETDQTMAIMRAAITASKKKDEGAYISTNEAMEYLRSQGIEF